MDSIEFILIIASFAAVLLWYLHNAGNASDGLLGFLALTDDPALTKPTQAARAYRMKSRAAHRAHEIRSADGVKGATTEKPSYRRLDEGQRMRRRFRRQDEVRYRVKDKAPDAGEPQPGPVIA